MKTFIKTAGILGVLGATLALSSCATLTGKQVKPLQGPPVQNATTPYTKALECLAQYVPKYKRVSIAVDNIPDLTGKYSVYEGGYEVTQGAEDMAISALGETHAYYLVERTALGIPLMELKLANKYILRGYHNYNNIKVGNGYARKLYDGEFVGSDYVLTGAITGIDYNIDSGGFDLTIDGIGGGYRAFAMDVTIDLRLINTKTTHIVMVLPLNKEIWGYENKAGVVHFFGQTLVEFNAGRIRQEPIDLAVRAVLEDGIFDMTKKLYHLPSTVCSQDISYAKQFEKKPQATK